jgi:hypothetical protein
MWTYKKRVRNEGPGDAGQVYLQPVDDAHSIVDGGFWHSIPADKVMPFQLADETHVGLFTMRFELSWDDGFRLGRDKEMLIRALGD